MANKETGPICGECGMLLGTGVANCPTCLDHLQSLLPKEKENEFEEGLDNLFESQDFQKMAELSEEEKSTNLVIALIGRASVGKDALAKNILGIDEVDPDPLPGSTTGREYYKATNLPLIILNTPGLSDLEEELSNKTEELEKEALLPDVILFLTREFTKDEMENYKRFKNLPVPTNKKMRIPVALVRTHWDQVHKSGDAIVAKILKHSGCNREDFFRTACPEGGDTQDLDGLAGWISKRVDESADLIKKKQTNAKRIADAKWRAKRAKDAAEKMAILNEEASRIIKVYTWGAAGIGAAPIPGSDTAALIPLQVRMCKQIADIYDKEVNALGLLIRTIMGSVGKWIYLILITLAKGVAWLHPYLRVIIPSVASSVAGGLTYSLGRGFQRGCIKGWITEDNITAANEFAKYVKRNKKKFNEEARQVMKEGRPSDFV